jgi:HSP20 family protein
MSPDHRTYRIASGPNGEAALRAGGEAPPPLLLPADGADVYTPAIDIHEGPEGLILEADLPGVTESSLRIDLEHNVLNLQALVVRPMPPGARPLHEESSVVGFFRSFILTDDIQKDAIRAELKNGVLRLILPRAERAKARRIEVSSSCRPRAPDYNSF